MSVASGRYLPSRAAKLIIFWIKIIFPVDLYHKQLNFDFLFQLIGSLRIDDDEDDAYM